MFTFLMYKLYESSNNPLTYTSTAAGAGAAVGGFEGEGSSGGRRGEAEGREGRK